VLSCRELRLARSLSVPWKIIVIGQFRHLSDVGAMPLNSHQCQVAIAIAAAGWIESGDLEDAILGTGLRGKDGKHVA
jgi:hypothetical protein